MAEPCVIDDCNRAVVGRGWCNRHWLRWRRHGSPTAGGHSTDGTFEERLWSRVRKTDGCWLWDGPRGDGRGVLRRDGRLVYAYRAVYEALVGPIPDGLTLDHLCRVPACVNPNHLEAVTSWVNTSRSESWTAQRARATHCIHGHAFTPANTKWVGPEHRHRQCIQCERERERQRIPKAAGA